MSASMSTTPQSNSKASWSSVTYARVPPFLQRRLIPNFNNSVECEHMLLELGQFEDILSTVRTNLCAWFYISGLGTNAARHKTTRHQVGGLLCYRFYVIYGKVTTYKLHLHSDFCSMFLFKVHTAQFLRCITLSRKIPVFYGTLVLLPRAEQLTNDPCLYTHESGIHFHIRFL